jgi:hypothetical protein
MPSSPISLDTILPNIAQTLDGTGFIFGAGSSFEAGYPLMPALTIDVVRLLTADERSCLDEVLTAAGETYDESTGMPNIETLADLVIAHSTNSGSPKYISLETRLRELVLQRILAVHNPTLDHHCRFLNALKRRAFGLSCTVWIFSTNYDLLFEIAAARTGVLIHNGFHGATERFFYPQQFRSISGEISGNRFSPHNHLTIKLIKLHGSISWTEEASSFYERHPAALSAACHRVMVLPRRKKLIDTLAPPYDSLFTLASKVLGGECKYLVSCGFSFGDEHINQQLLQPVLQANKCRLFVLAKEEPPGIAPFKCLPTFSAAFGTHLYNRGKQEAGSTDLWEFSKFASLF